MDQPLRIPRLHSQSKVECGHCGEAMVLVEDSFYVHASTGETYCAKLEELDDEHATDH